MVYDEADRLLTYGRDPELAFTKVLEKILKTPTLPKVNNFFKLFKPILKMEDRINMLFSATFSTEVQSLAQTMILRKNKFVMISNGRWQGPNHRIEQNVIQVYNQEKFEKLREILRMEQESAEKNHRKFFKFDAVD